MNTERIDKRTRFNLTTLIKLCFAVVMVLVIGICIFMESFPHATYATYYDFPVEATVMIFKTLPNYLLIIGGAAFGLLLLCICSFLSDRLRAKLSHAALKRYLFAISIVLMLVQVFAVYNYYFTSEWDVDFVARGSSAAALHQDLSEFSDYFSTYPNNLFILGIYTAVKKLLFVAGVSANALFPFLLINSVIFWFTGLLVFQLIHSYTHSYKYSFVGYALYYLMVWMSPWASIAYSDSLGLFFPAAILWVYKIKLNGVSHTHLKLFFIAFLSYLGYKLKPQVFICDIALVIVELPAIIECLKSCRKKIVSGVLVLAAGLVLSFGIVSVCTESIGITIDEEKSFSITHYLMMGLNPDDLGKYSANDFAMSHNAATRAERTALNLRVAKERIKTMGFSGVLRQLCSKTLTNYTDGTFAWGGEGLFYAYVSPEKMPFFSAFFRDIYYNQPDPEPYNFGYTGRYYMLWSNVEESLWMAVLLFALFAVRNADKETSFIMLALLGLTAFQLIFEARARYLFIYVPFYIILASVGIASLSDSLRARKRLQ